LDLNITARFAVKVSASDFPNRERDGKMAKLKPFFYCLFAYNFRPAPFSVTNFVDGKNISGASKRFEGRKLFWG